MRVRWVGIGIVALSIACLAGTAGAGATHCTMRYSLEGWSVFYKTASGNGTITCDNGQSAYVTISAKGGGLTVGKSKVVNGEGRFSEVSNIGELFGTYGAAEAHAGMVKSSDAQVVTKGTVSLALSGKGQGVDLGIDFGKFTIAEAAKKKNK